MNVEVAGLNEDVGPAGETGGSQCYRRRMLQRTIALAPSALDRVLLPLHAWVWRDPHRRARKLLRFAETEANGGRDLARAAELTGDRLLRRLYLRHSEDESRHAALFRSRGRALLRALAPKTGVFEADWLTPGERHAGALRIEGDRALLAFLHLSEKVAAQRFTLYLRVLAHDPPTREVFANVLNDEAFHMSYTQIQLARIAGGSTRRELWLSRLHRLWKGYLRLATALAAVLGTLFLRLQYFIVLPPFAVLAKRAASREPPGFVPARANPDLTSQY
jgi:hypothetical protein